MDTDEMKVAMVMYVNRRLEAHGKQIDNSRLYAGSPMFYYCEFCGQHTETLSESHWKIPVTVCVPCKELNKIGLLPLLAATDRAVETWIKSKKEGLEVELPMDRLLPASMPR